MPPFLRGEVDRFIASFECKQEEAAKSRRKKDCGLRARGKLTLLDVHARERKEKRGKVYIINERGLLSEGELIRVNFHDEAGSREERILLSHCAKKTGAKKK